MTRVTAGLKYPKPRLAALERKQKRQQLKADDEAENKKVRQRSGGRCEVIHLYSLAAIKSHPADADEAIARCNRRACQIHHMIGGWGRRARGDSRLAEHKQHVCARCHAAITGHELKRIGEVMPLWTDYYELVR